MAMPTLPDNVTFYRQTPTFDETTVPAGLTAEHATKAGVWGVIRVEAGSLRYTIRDTRETFDLDPDTAGFIAPEVPHHVSLLGPVRFRVEFYR